MQRLIYTSSARHNLKAPHITDILTTSRENNRKAGVTGLLIYHEGTFLQVLEGDKAVLDALYARIRRDWRHSDCKMLLNECVTGRAFAGWSMLYRLGEDMDARHVRQLRDIRSAVESCETGDFASHPMLSVFLRAFLSNLRMHDAA
ncbi:BLUF domain-containing protein [Henriciella sp. AS95]|uniref:BLUF domain-containing protein n=1 Tax=Henriciella sp. AS95 TaxID=3135782 RepID=UPI00316D8BA9